MRQRIQKLSMYTIHNIFYLIFAACICLLLFPGVSHSQESNGVTIQGTITEEGTGETLPAVHAYISQTTVGTTSDETGFFEFNTTLTGTHELVFSFVGFKTKRLAVYLDSDLDIDVELEPDTFSLDEVEVVTTGDAVWYRNLERFKNRFIGTSYFARQAEIKNPWVIDFDKDDEGQQIAYTSRPIEIENHALGYKLYIDLVDFTWDESENVGLYTFYSRFEEMQTDSRREQTSWESSRERSYRGSFEHFLKSLYNDQLTRNRFEPVVEGTENRIQIEQLSEFEMRRVRNILTVQGTAAPRSLKGFRLYSPVDVLYGRSGRVTDSRARSRLVPMHDSGIFLVTEAGRLFDPAAIRVDGAWSDERVGDLLPITFSLDD